MDRRVTRWFDTERGISEDTLTAFGIGFEDGLLRYTYSNGVKLRTAPWEAERRIWWEKYPGKDKIEMFCHPDEEVHPNVIITEGESDAMKLWQELHKDNPDTQVSVFGISGLSNWQERYATELADAEHVYVVLDKDDAYENPLAAKAVTDTWPRIKDSLGRKAHRVMLPPGVKDVCEFFKVYDLSAFRDLIKSSRELKLHFKPLDMTKPLEDVEWLVDGLFARGDAAMVFGPGGVGKSWYTMSLATAIVEGHEKWLDMAIPEAMRGGKVVYVDKENPEDIFRRRWVQLGYTPGNKQLHPLWYPDVYLDESPEFLYEDVEQLEPVLVVLDSLSRIHHRNENSAEDMNPLMNDGVLPMARKLGATVLTIHHTPHDAVRARGATAIANAHDMTISIDWRKTKKGEKMDSIIIRPDKLRRTGVREYLETKIVDLDDGEPAERVEIQIINGEGMPF